MAQVKMQVNTTAEINRDLTLKVVHEATGQEFTTTPFLDGSAVLRNVPPGAYRVRAMHPNLPTPVYDGRIRVFPDQPTFAPIQIPKDLFSNTPIASTTAADLGPVRHKLSTAGTTADGQANKKGGQPIYADDWNVLAGVTADVAGSVVELTQKVAPMGHDHPELVQKVTEVQQNLDKLLDVFGKTVTELQRQLQLLALDVRVNRALDKIGVPDRSEVQKTLGTLEETRRDTPYIYTTASRRAGEGLVQQIVKTVPPEKRELLNTPEVAEALSVTNAMAAASPVYDYVAELQHHSRIDRIASKAGVAEALPRGLPTRSGG